MNHFNSLKGRKQIKTGIFKTEKEKQSLPLSASVAVLWLEPACVQLTC